ncbi:unnamed protein product [Paramecium pentaurelia]|uniref:Uncharacterized protein n=1 Tax=Paramecium pentaurelia TaxID=43138 RepID=A0A8S1W6X3_9CILI|nr:unnamed protein product [Paramecium pentaurelia]
MIILGFINFLISYKFYKNLIFCKYQNWQLINEKDSHQRKYYQYFIYSGLIRIFKSNFQESIFSSILSLANFNKETTINTTISFFNSFYFGMQLYPFAYFYSYLSYKNLTNHLSVLEKGSKNQSFK